MKPKSVYKGRSQNGLDIVIRYPKMGDVKSMCDYMNKVSKEKTYITWQGEKITLKYEKEYLKGQREKIKNKESIKLVLFVNRELAGISDIGMGKKIKSHIGNFGITIAKKYRGKGLGKLLMKNVLNEAKKLPRLKIITLEVFSKNKNAIECQVLNLLYH
ncbi:GNAT family N-acetyltransferase [Patescibacteria group bacterium]|nr:GNAT family N-acetyltransferase [Patescibacteria group bacterium]MBU1256814.1 GNAT family N-acetyltransferase [Patescibacteria group bacterium]MBU1457646.1 GNAT family N-acetyltransferase [Patescibacteria group bacterium]